MLLVVSLLPIVLYIVGVWSIDRFALVSAKLLGAMVACGLLAALASYGLFLLAGDYFPDRVYATIDAVVEEIIKAIPLLVLACRKKTVFFIDSIICGAAVGGGFSILENMLYLQEGLGFGTALFRGLEVSLIHMGCSAIVSVALMFLVRQAERRRSRLAVKREEIVLAIILIIVAIALHVVHNTFHFNPFVQTLTVFGLMALLLQGSYLYDSHQIHRWLDRSLTKQLNLLLSIGKGHMEETPAGQYLLSVKDSFPPEVFSTIIDYVRLHTELAVVSKSRFMVREAGLEYPMDNGRRTYILDKYKEYQRIHAALGKTIRITIGPLLKFYPADRKALDELISDCRTNCSN